ncbi:MAG: betaine-aldehyde dehydrogenase [Pseudomonadota bacterium]|nr:aldehyde dehydrogenase family protein [Rubrivivax sp.]NLZ41523.1 aldehyde dehydrogenase family protein [Comamonadaceae bacterium]
MNATLEIFDPAAGRPIAQVPADDATSVAARAAAARRAQPAWAALPMAERLAVVQRYRAALVAQSDELAATLTREVGKPITQAKNELQGLLPRLDFFLGQAERAVRDEPVFDEAGMREKIGHEPLGLVANISAWNYPWFVGNNVIVPALLTGNAVVYKPSEYATLSGLACTRLLHAAGVPAEVLHCLVGAGAVGAALLDQPIDGLFFTGSHATGRRIARALAGRLVKLQLELGGKDPSYVRADADPEAAAESLADGAMYNTGQSCCSVERIYVHESVHEAFVARFVATVSGFRRGDPMDPATYIGAITRAAQIEVLEAQVADALAKGARLHCGGRRGAGPGNWFEPTVLTEVDHRMDVMREESFGPLVGIQKVRSDEEALALMNDTRYGLTAGVYTKDEAGARALLARVRAGSVYWNCCDRVSPRLPWSGVGDSGIGLTLGVEGIRTFTRPKAWHLRSPA